MPARRPDYYTSETFHASGVRASYHNHGRLEHRNRQGRRTRRIQEALVDYAEISLAMATMQAKAAPVPQNNGRRHMFGEEADLLKYISLHGTHLAERGQTIASFIRSLDQYDARNCVVEDSMGSL
jgi:hypothetical protein